MSNSPTLSPTLVSAVITLVRVGLQGYRRRCRRGAGVRRPVHRRINSPNIADGGVGEYNPHCINVSGLSPTVPTGGATLFLNLKEKGVFTFYIQNTVKPYCDKGYNRRQGVSALVGDLISAGAPA